MADMYQRQRNIVTRTDGMRVNVARFRGQLFVCATGCCCGRVQDGFFPVPEDLYHNEWERRRLRNVVHLTTVACLGPCALANVALLIFDGEMLWFHSIDRDELVLSIYDYIEQMLEADAYLPPTGELAELRFTASTWQDRPDGQPVADHRNWQTHRMMPPADDEHACALPPGAFPMDDESGGPERMIRSLDGASAMPRSNGELVFEAPWHGRAFGMAAALSENDAYAWNDFRDRLIDEIAVAEKRDEAFDYYACWLAAFESLLEEKGMVAAGEIDERTSEFEFGERGEVY